MAINIGIATSPFRESFQYAFDQEVEIVKENPTLEELNAYDLIIFSGGADIHPRIYGESITYSRGINNIRDDIEIDILAKAMALNIKIFGVCRGHQLINAYLGGRLLQDLFMGQKPSLTHSSPHPLDKINSDIFLKDIDVVNSLHHQGVVSIGKGLQKTSVHRKIVESTIGKNIYSVQFHPEFMLDLEEIKEFFNCFKSYVGKNIKKKDPKTINVSDVTNRPSRKHRTTFTRAILSTLEPRIRMSNNVEAFIEVTRDNSRLADTSLRLSIIPEHEEFIRTRYDRKISLNSDLGDLNTRDEELYIRMEEGEFESNEEYEELEGERTEIGDLVSRNLDEISSINSTLIECARDIIEIIDRGGWSDGGVEISENLTEDSVPEQRAREGVTLDISSVSPSEIDWSTVSNS